MGFLIDCVFCKNQHNSEYSCEERIAYIAKHNMGNFQDEWPMPSPEDLEPNDGDPYHDEGI